MASFFNQIYLKGIITLILFLITIELKSIDDNTSIGGRQAGMSGATVAHSDIWSVYNNQAGLAQIDKISIGAFNESRFNIGLGTKALGIILPTHTGTFGLIFTNFGKSGAFLQKFGLGYSKKLGTKFSAGIELEYLNLSLPGQYGNGGAFTFEAGIISFPVPNLSIGAHVFNPVKAQFPNQDDESIPTVFKTGLEYLFGEKVTVGIELEKTLTYSPNIKAGIDYNFYKNLYLRIGGASAPYQYSFGFGLDVFSVKADIAFSYIDPIGSISHISLSYSFK